MKEIKIQKDKFTVDIEEKYLFDLIEKIVLKAGGVGVMNQILTKRYGLNRYTDKSFGDNFRRWQRGRLKLYLDYYLDLGDFIGRNQKELYQKITKIKLAKSRAGLK